MQRHSMCTFVSGWIWREICCVALWHKRERRFGVKALFRHCGDGRWCKVWQAVVTSNMFFREREQKLKEERTWCNSSAELWRLLDDMHWDSGWLQPIVCRPRAHQLSVCQSNPDCRTWLHFWHTLSQMILIMSDILSEPLLSPLGKAHLHWQTHWYNEK